MMKGRHLLEYQNYYNYDRTHGAFGCTPNRRYSERLKITPFSDEVWERFNLAIEPRQHRFVGLEWFFEEKNRRRKLR